MTSFSCALSPGVPYLPQKLLVISDISADSEGSLQFMKNCTSVDRPYENTYPARGDPIGKFFTIKIKKLSRKNMKLPVKK